MAEIAQTFSIDPYAAERSKIARQQKFAELLQSQALQPNEKFSYAGIEAPISAAGGLAKALQAGMSGYLQGDAARKEDELVGKYEKRDAERQSAANEFLVDLQRGKTTPERDFGSTDTPGSFPLMPGAMEQDGRSVMPQQQTPYSAQERQAKAVQALGSNNPYLAQVAPMVYASAEGQMTREGDRAFRTDESRLARDARSEEARQRAEDRRWEIEQRLRDAGIAREEAAALKRELAQLSADTSKAMADTGARSRADAQNSKPPPAPILKQFNEANEAAATAVNINTVLDKHIQAMGEGGDLQLGPVNNRVYEMQNLTNSKEKGPIAYAAFRSDMERLRNESLRLNAGVQTDGDAQRAWNEIFNNITNHAFVQQRLGDIKGYNEQAAETKRANARTIADEYPSLKNNAPGSSAPSPAVNSADQEAMNWAKANPNDPRSAAIMKRLGGQ